MSDHRCETESSRPTLLARFIWSLILNAGLAVGEIVMSLITGSTALLADGLNNLDDTAALLLSIYSERAAKRPADRRHTFGHPAPESPLPIPQTLRIEYALDAIESGVTFLLLTAMATLQARPRPAAISQVDSADQAA